MDAKPDLWRRRWLVIRISLGASCGLGAGLFFVEPALAAHIASPISLISVSITGLAGAYIGGAAWESGRKDV